jgi:hypothetical protein
LGHLGARRVDKVRETHALAIPPPPLREQLALLVAIADAVWEALRRGARLLVQHVVPWLGLGARARARVRLRVLRACAAPTAGQSRHEASRG